MTTTSPASSTLSDSAWHQTESTAVTRYVPGGSSGKRTAPPSSVTAVPRGTNAVPSQKAIANSTSDVASAQSPYQSATASGATTPHANEWITIAPVSVVTSTPTSSVTSAASSGS